MDRAAYVTLHREASCKVRSELDIIALSRRQPAQDSGVEVVNYLEAVRLHRIIIYNVDDNVLAERYVHDRPRSRMIRTPIEPHVHTLIRHYDGKNGRVWRACRTIPAIRGLRTKEMKRISSNEKTGYNNHEGPSDSRNSSGL